MNTTQISAFRPCHSPQSFHKPGGGLWVSLPSAFFFFFWPIKLLLHGVKKKNETESKYPQTVSPGWLDCGYFGPFRQCVVYCRGPKCFLSGARTAWWISGSVAAGETAGVDSCSSQLSYSNQKCEDRSHTEQSGAFKLGLCGDSKGPWISVLCNISYISHYKFKLYQLCALGQGASAGATFLCLAQDSAMLTAKLLKAAFNTRTTFPDHLMRHHISTFLQQRINNPSWLQLQLLRPTQ